MGISNSLKKFEKNALRPLTKTIRGFFQQSKRIDALEARIWELERLIQEDMGLKLIVLDKQNNSAERGQREVE